MLKIGQEVPDLTVQAFHNEEIKTIRLSDYRGKWLVMVFYPGDFTFICPTELEETAERYPEFQKLGAEVMSVSTDSAYVHKAWHDQSPAIKKVAYPMLADTTGELSRAFGTYQDGTGVALRGSFIIDPDGVLQAMEINNLSIGRSADELLRKVQAAQFVREHPGEVCPASWRPGGTTLRPGLDLVGKI